MFGKKTREENQKPHLPDQLCVGCCCGILEICLKRVWYSWKRELHQRCQKMPNQTKALKPSSRNVWTIPNHQRDTAERWCTSQIPSCNMPVEWGVCTVRAPLSGIQKCTQILNSRLDSTMANITRHLKAEKHISFISCWCWNFVIQRMLQSCPWEQEKSQDSSEKEKPFKEFIVQGEIRKL